MGSSCRCRLVGTITVHSDSYRHILMTGTGASRSSTSLSIYAKLRGELRPRSREDSVGFDRNAGRAWLAIGRPLDDILIVALDLKLLPATLSFSSIPDR